MGLTFLIALKPLFNGDGFGRIYVYVLRLRNSNVGLCSYLGVGRNFFHLNNLTIIPMLNSYKLRQINIVDSYYLRREIYSTESNLESALHSRNRNEF